MGNLLIATMFWVSSITHVLHGGLAGEQKAAIQPKTTADGSKMQSTFWETLLSSGEGIIGKVHQQPPKCYCSPGQHVYF